jgi:hypothetical protein
MGKNMKKDNFTTETQRHRVKSILGLKPKPFSQPSHRDG